MFERIGRLAERAANGVSLSRRGFFGRLGQGALTTAGVLGGLLALTNKVQASNHTLYSCSYGFRRSSGKCSIARCPLFIQSCGGCPQYPCCELISQSAIGTC
jgi:hypothetical protein